MSKLHTHFPKGAHVYVILKDGSYFEDQWVPLDKPGKVKFRKRGVVELKKIRTISYRRHQTWLM